MITNNQETDGLFNGKLVHCFLDASVPPQYHRSYIITVDTENIKMTVDSYGTILSEYKSAFFNKSFQQFLNEIQQTGIANCELLNDHGCRGGTTDNFQLLRDSILLKAMYITAGVPSMVI